MTGPVVRLDPGATIALEGEDATVSREGQAQLVLRGEAPRVRAIATMLASPRPEHAVRAAIDGLAAGPDPDLLGTLHRHGVLQPWTLAQRLAELHRQTARASEWGAESPAAEVARVAREAAAEGALELPPPPPLAGSLAQALTRRRSVHGFASKQIGAQELAGLLAWSAGLIPGETPAPLVAGAPAGRRTHPSGGALYPIEARVIALRVEDVEPGIHRYEPLGHRLVPHRPAPSARALAELLGDHPVEGAAAVVLLCMDMARQSLGKYGLKAYRLALLEAGHIAQSLLLVGAAQGFAGLPICGFHDERLAAAAGLGELEAVLYVVAIGRPLPGGSRAA